MLTPLDTPTADDVLRLHQWVGERAGAFYCTCGEMIPRYECDHAMALHQLAMLQASDLALVSVHGTAGVVQQAAAVVAAFGAGKSVEALHDQLLLLRQRLEAMTK